LQIDERSTWIWFGWSFWWFSRFEAAASVTSGMGQLSLDKFHLSQTSLFLRRGCAAALSLTGTPKALQLHLGHASPFMTMRYLSALTAEEALRIQQEVEFD